ncbi:MAG: OmpH family outer membrane protein [Humidesulfovibrio sp.]|nr:OmpH family outer membrane protein [Humidesulfovibrio sp.]
MRKLLALALYLFLLQSVAFAAGAGPVKIAAFDPNEAVKNSEPGAEAIKQLEAKLKPESDKIERERKEFIKLQENFQKQAFGLAPDARQDKERELRRKEFELTENMRRFQNAANREQSSKLSEIERVLGEAVRDYCAKNGVTLLIAKVPGITYYVEPSSDITKIVTLELNKAWHKRSAK